MSPLQVRLLLAGSLALLWPLAPLAEEPPPERPRIGLVLSGGGARGFAHIGVLEVMEELRIPVHALAGTSMGAVVGGLYAQGLTPAELVQVVDDIDWANAFEDTPPRRERSLRRKRDDFLYLTGLRLNFKDFSLAFPKGLIEGQQITNILGALTLPAATVRDFDTLPIPYRAVATDAVTGEAVVLSGGHLSRAQRASMAIPGAFSPVEIDGRLLVDGGLAMNLPVQVVRDMGVDVVIAIDIGSDPTETKQVESIFDIGGQSLGLLMHRNTLDSRALLREEDLFVAPHLPGIGTASFEMGPEAIAYGRAGAQEVAEALARYSVSEEEWQSWKQRRAHVDRSPPVIDSFRIDNQSPLAEEVIRRRIEVPRGEPLDVVELQRQLGALYGEDIFERVVFSIDDVDGRTELTVHVIGKETGRNWVRFGLGLETNFQGESQFQLSALATRNPLNAFGAEARTALAIGETSFAAFEYYQPIDYASNFFVLPQASFSIGSRNVFENDERVAKIELRRTFVGGAFGWQPSNWFELRLGGGFLSSEADQQIGTTVLQDVDFEGGTATGELRIDTLDSVRFPREGTFFDSKVDWVFDSGSDSLGIGEFRLLQSFSFGDNTITGTAKFGTTWNDSRPIPTFSLGGFLDLSGRIPDERAGPHMLFGSLIYYHRVANPRFLSLNLPVYVGGSLEAGNTFDERSDIDFDELLIAGSVFLGMDTPIGPIYLAYGLSEQGESSPYFFLGQIF
jgi:NTE family protein